MILISKEIEIQMEKLIMRKGGIHRINSTIHQEEIIVRSFSEMNKMVTKYKLVYARINGQFHNSRKNINITL